MAAQKLTEASLMLRKLQSDLEHTEQPKPKVSVPKQLPNRRSGSLEIEPIKPRTSFPKEKPKQQPKKEKSIIDKIKDIVPEVQAAEVNVNGTIYDIPDEIVNLSNQLENNPALIYAYVRGVIVKNLFH